jgi:predicted transcriptional regulator of viral defense system
LAHDAVLAYHTALEFHGKAYSVFERFTYLSETAVRPLTFRGQQYRRCPFPKTLSRKKEESLGVVKADRLGVDVRVTSLERTLVDVLDRVNLSGGWEEVWKSLETVEFFDIDQVVKYAILLENATNIAKVGFFLEQHKEALMVNDSHFQKLRKHRPIRPHYMEPRQRSHVGQKNQLIKEWNLIVPSEVVEKKWEESSENL